MTRLLHLASKVLQAHRWPIRAYFALLVALFVVAAAAAVVYVRAQTERDGRRDAVAKAQFAATTAAKQLGDQMKVVELTVAQLAANPQISNVFRRPAGCSLTFAGIAGADSSHLDILGPNGKVACSSSPQSVGRRHVGEATRPWLRRALVAPIFVAPATDSVTGARVAITAAPIPGGKGIVAAFVNLTPIASHLASLYGGADPLEFLVTASDGRTVIARSIGPKQWIGASLAGTGFAAGDGRVERRDVDGVTRLYAQARVSPVGWRFFAGEDKAAALAEGSRLERRQFAIIVVGLIAVMLVAWVVYRSLVAPIRRLSRAVRATDVDSFSAPVPVSGAAELIALGDDINGLISAASHELLTRRQAEATARASETNYRLLFESNPNPMWVFDTETLRFLAVNEAAVRNYGYTHDEFLEMTIEDIRPSAEIARLRSVVDLDAVLKRDLNHGGLWLHLRKDGTVIDAEITSHTHWFQGREARVVLAIDVTERLRSENALLESEARYRELFENAFEPIATVTIDEQITDVNAAFERALGYTREELVGSSLGDYLTPEGRQISAQQTKQKMTDGVAGTTFEHEFIRKDGRSVILEVSSRVIEKDGVPVGVQGSCRDITARKQAELEIHRLSEVNRHQALHDDLTALPNRAHFRQRVEQEINVCQENGSELAVLLIDLDRFKEINDTLGHHYGDLLLIELARRLESVVRSSDTIARLGGDEFGMLLNLSGPPSALEHALKRIHDALAQPFQIKGLPLFVEASIGIALFPTHGADVDLLLQRADIAMYAAKETGSPHAVYATDLDRHDTTSLTLLADLPRAIREGELVLHYQPKMSIRTGEIASVEALIRWQHPTRGLIPPGDFIPLAEKTALIQPLTRYVLDEALGQCKRWEQHGHSLNVAVNLSMRNLHEPTLPDDVGKLLQKWDLPGERLTLEITESAIVADPAKATAIVDQLAALGAVISVDDFGTGYTSLAQLARLKLDQIKIDRSFIVNMADDTDDTAIVRSTISLGHDLGLEVVAEGVETKTCWDKLALLGCDTLQGYLISRPLPAEDITRLLTSHSETHQHKGEAAA